MKKNTACTLILALSMIAAAPSIAQKKKNKGEEAPPREPPVMPMENNLVVYQGSVDAKGTRADLYKKTLDWYMSFYKAPTSVIQDKDEEKGVITGKARFQVSNIDEKTGAKTNAGLVQYTIIVSCSDNKYEYRIERINWKSTSYYGIEKWFDKEGQYYRKDFVDYLEQTDTYIKDLLAQLQKAVAG